MLEKERLSSGNRRMTACDISYRSMGDIKGILKAKEGIWMCLITFFSW
jgi:hypothetical protein